MMNEREQKEEKEEKEQKKWKEYYKVILKDGSTVQLWDLEEKIAGIARRSKTLKDYNYIYALVRYCDALEYINRAGFKDPSTEEEDNKKGHENMELVLQEIGISNLLYLIKRTIKLLDPTTILSKRLQREYDIYNEFLPYFLVNKPEKPAKPEKPEKPEGKEGKEGKNYYKVTLKDGRIVQLWDLEEKITKQEIILEGILGKMDYHYIYALVRFCDVLEYFNRAGIKDPNTEEEDMKKAYDNIELIEERIGTLCLMGLIRRTLDILDPDTVLFNRLFEYLKSLIYNHLIYTLDSH